MKLSILDLMPVRTGQNTAQSLAATLELARWADQAGFTRYWVAEHHNMAAVASTNPPVLAAIIAGATSKIRVGSGGVMLPNHSPLIIAEQFALLEAAFPGRIDLGLGRAPGSDPVITALLNRDGVTSDAQQFPRHVAEIRGLLTPQGVTVDLASGGGYDLKSTPEAVGSPMIWLLGSSDFSAQLAAHVGLPYVFANHFGMGEPQRPLDAYHSGFVASAEHEAPRTFMTVTAITAETREQAEALARPQLLQFMRRRFNQHTGKIDSVEAAAGIGMDEREQALFNATGARWLIGDADSVAERITALAAEFGVDEVMISASSGESEAAPADRTPARLRGYQLLAERLL